MLKNIFSNWLALVLRGVISVILTPILIHYLGDFNFGLWVLVMSVVDYAGILDLGIRPTLHRFVGRLTGTGDRRGLNEVISTAITVSTAMGCLVVVLAFVCQPVIPRFFSVQGSAAAEFRGLLLLLGLNIAVLFPGRVLGAYLCGLERFDLYNAVDVLCSVIRGAVIIVILHYGAGVEGIALVSLVTSVLLLFLNLLAVFHVDPQVSLDPRQSTWIRTRELASYSFFLLLTTAGDYLRFYTDSIVIARLLSVALITPFNVAGRLMEYFKALAAGLAGPLMPRMSFLEGRGKSEDLEAVFLSGTRATALLSFLIGLLLWMDGKPLLQLWVGERFVSSYSLLMVLTAGYVVTIAQLPSNCLLYALNRHQLLGLWTLVEGVANLVLSIYWARTMGLVGVALGTTVPMLVTGLILMPVYVLWVLKLPAARYVREGLLRPLGVFAFSATACALALHPAATTTIFRFSLVVSAQVLLFAVAAFTFGVKPFERRYLTESVRLRIQMIWLWAGAAQSLNSPVAAPKTEWSELHPPLTPPMEEFVGQEKSNEGR